VGVTRAKAVMRATFLGDIQVVVRGRSWSFVAAAWRSNWRKSGGPDESLDSVTPIVATTIATMGLIDRGLVGINQA
jgi:hypothetical protein